MLFELRPEASPESVVALREALLHLSEVVSSLRSISVGFDLALRSENFDVGLVAEFDDVAGYLEYRDHPEHLDVIERHVTPVVDRRVAVQYELNLDTQT